jgi:hypothetical protein
MPADRGQPTFVSSQRHGMDNVIARGFAGFGGGPIGQLPQAGGPNGAADGEQAARSEGVGYRCGRSVHSMCPQHFAEIVYLDTVLVGSSEVNAWQSGRWASNGTTQPSTLRESWLILVASAST